MRRATFPVDADSVLRELERLLPEQPENAPSASIRVTAFGSALGCLVAAAADDGLVSLEFADGRLLPKRLRRLSAATGLNLYTGDFEFKETLKAELDAYLAGSSATFNTPIRLVGTPFQLKVWKALQRIPYGSTVNYLDLADELGCPEAVRAVAGANGSNRLAIVVPCHRVIGRNGKLTGYAGGIDRKRWLLDLEATRVGRPVQSSLF
jgi:AraC family transcriptional regulator of adaptative response/methylated-DNA-[protein]-cysteine methyltransferase